MGNRLNLEDTSELVQIGKAMHDQRAEKSKDVEIAIENIVIDKLTSEYVIEIKKSDADIDAAKWQLLYYLYILETKGIYRKGKIEVIEKNKTVTNILIYDLNDSLRLELENHIIDIEELISGEKIPPVLNKPTCKKCAYYEYCYI